MLTTIAVNSMTTAAGVDGRFRLNRLFSRGILAYFAAKVLHLALRVLFD